MNQKLNIYNKFTEQGEKSTLRERDFRQLKKLINNNKFNDDSLEYCGLPSVEFLDLLSWQSIIKMADCIEYDAEMYEKMNKYINDYNFNFSYDLHYSSIEDYLNSTNRSYDLYNLDYYGGYIYGSVDKNYPKINMLEKIFINQNNEKRNFVLIATIQIRDKGIEEYEQYIDQVKSVLTSNPNLLTNISDHSDFMSKMKVGFLSTCLSFSERNNFNYKLYKIIKYKNYLHYFIYFEHIGSTLPVVTLSKNTAKLILNSSIFYIEGDDVNTKIKKTYTKL